MLFQNDALNNAVDRLYLKREYSEIKTETALMSGQVELSARFITKDDVWMGRSAIHFVVSNDMLLLLLFVVGSRPCSERFFSGYSGFPLSSKTNISKFQLTLKSPERDEPIKYVFIYLWSIAIQFTLLFYLSEQVRF